MEQILQQLQQLGFGNLDWDQIYGQTQPGDVATELYREYGATGDPWESAMFSPLTQGMLRGATYGQYAPQVRQEGQSLLGGLTQQLGGQEATQAAGGFAGSSGFGKQQAGARDVYGKGMQGVLSNVGQQRSAATGNIQDIISSWMQTAQSMRYGD